MRTYPSEDTLLQGEQQAQKGSAFFQHYTLVNYKIDQTQTEKVKNTMLLLEKSSNISLIEDTRICILASLEHPNVIGISLSLHRQSLNKTSLTKKLNQPEGVLWISLQQ